MSAKSWTTRVGAESGAAERVAETEEKTRLAASGTDATSQRIGPEETTA